MYFVFLLIYIVTELWSCFKNPVFLTTILMNQEHQWVVVIKSNVLTKFIVFVYCSLGLPLLQEGLLQEHIMQHYFITFIVLFTDKPFRCFMSHLPVAWFAGNFLTVTNLTNVCTAMKRAKNEDMSIVLIDHAILL